MLINPVGSFQHTFAAIIFTNSNFWITCLCEKGKTNHIYKKKKLKTTMSGSALF